ncbi:AraC family transcriptional regulator [Lutibacter sp. HS1-25]|uniref:AraC family transcriptional regulator n=1 Tax=Lutibacter sp. HS1-25 TaxID=2485000 RepID=UPI001011D13C|nr:AraC family transcriptional regulator [Lutibacter sp. HS1-25]RXP46219.1 AraC family transcriptional regulator [Lutibacter sp. HS1-25]
MKNIYRKYLMVFEQDKNWGFYVNNLGRTIFEKNLDYPSKDHPDNYVFTWDKGRTLDEFHLVLITKGEGVFDSNETGIIKISDGDVFLLFPGVWHRYKPLKKTGWTERWVGFSGEIAQQFLSNGFFTPNEPIISKCNKPAVLNHFNALFKLFDEESFGFQRLASGICLQLMAELYNIKQGGNKIKDLNSMVSRAKSLMYQNIYKSIDLVKIASKLGVSYSKFRLDFKKQTGVSPLQYYLLLKIEKSKELLLNTDKNQKEIAFELGFESDYYFNRLFKQKTGLTPGQFRKTQDQLQP